MIEYKNLTLDKIKSICTNHLGQSRDCETCPVYKFCIKNFSEYPSGWKLEDSANVKGK